MEILNGIGVKQDGGCGLNKTPDGGLGAQGTRNSWSFPAISKAISRACS